MKNAISFTLLGKQITFTQEEVYSDNLYRKFESVYLRVGKLFTKKYKTYGTLRKLVEECPFYAVSATLLGLEQAQKILVANGYYSVTIDDLLEEYMDFVLDPFIDAYGKISDQYAEIVCNAEELNRYRTARRKNRGRWVGGGFGHTVSETITSSVKGAVTAGAMNMVGGMFHGTANVIGSAISSSSDKRKMAKIYDDPQTMRLLTSALCKTIFNIYFVICEVLDIEIMPVDIKKANALFSNIEQIPANDIKNVLANCLYMNPYEKEYYEYAIQKYGDPNMEIQSYADYFGMGKELKEYKESLFLFKYERTNIATSKEAERVIDRLNKDLNYYGLKSCSVLEYLKTKKFSLDVQERTYRGKLYPTRAEKEKQIAIDRDVESRTYNGIIYETRELMQEKIKQDEDIKSRTYKGKVYETKELMQEQIERDKNLKARTFNGIVYDTIEEANEAKQFLSDKNKAQKDIITNLESDNIWKYSENLQKYCRFVLENYSKFDNAFGSVALFHYLGSELSASKWNNYTSMANIYKDIKNTDSDPKLRQLILDGLAKRIVFLSCQNINFTLYTQQNSKILSDKMRALEAEYGAIVQSCEEYNRAHATISKYNNLQTKADLYIENRRTPMSVLLFILKTVIITIIVSVIAFLIKPIFALFVLIYGFIYLIYYLFIDKDVDGYKRDELKEAYDYLKNNR